MKPYRIGITGKIASGKSLASHHIASHYHFYLIDADKVGHRILEDPNVIQKISEHFPEVHHSYEKGIDRKILSDIVFRDLRRLEILQDITWTAILQNIYREMDLYPRCVIEALGLFQSPLHTKCDFTLYIDCTLQNIQQRLKTRGLDSSKMQKILDAQEKYATSMALADEVISNNTTIEELYTKLDEMMEKLDLVEISSQRRK
jgi:dephospho-CoA kinase